MPLYTGHAEWWLEQQLDATPDFETVVLELQDAVDNGLVSLDEAIAILEDHYLRSTIS